MVSNSIENYNISLKDVLKSLKALVAKAQFIATKTELNRLDTIILKLNKLLTSPDSQYFNTEAKLYISSMYITLADVVRVMASKGVAWSRSGCENKMLQSARKFVMDFGPYTAAQLIDDPVIAKKTTQLDMIELQILKIEQGIDYTANGLDKLLIENGLEVNSLAGFDNPNITQEQLDKFVELIEPYTAKGKTKRLEELQNLSNVLWYFRRKLVENIDDPIVVYILNAIHQK